MKKCPYLKLDRKHTLYDYYDKKYEMSTLKCIFLYGMYKQKYLKPNETMTWCYYRVFIS